MLLRLSNTSPFLRKVTVLVYETGLIDRAPFDAVDAWAVVTRPPGTGPWRGDFR